MLNAIILNVIIMGVGMLNVIMQSVIMLNVIMLNVTMLSVVAPHKKQVTRFWPFVSDDEKNGFIRFPPEVV
jgi:hypothetical protein